MKKLFTLILLATVSTSLFSQSEFPILFESSNELANWEMFENGSNDAENFAIVANENTDGINPADSCLQFIVAADGQPWAGASSESYGDIEITEENSIITMLVNKDVESRCLIKFEVTQEEFIEVFAENTITGDWEELTFDFSDAIGNIYPKIVIFPDFPEGMGWGERTESTTTLISNIQFKSGVNIKDLNSMDLVKVYPNPASEFISVTDNAITKIEIFNSIGQMVYSENYQSVNTTDINVAHLKNGMYIVRSVNAKSTKEVKFLKK